MSVPAAARFDHRVFLNQYYGLSRHIYDATRKYYLFGRDRLLADLLSEPWSHLVEIGSGTGRNLTLLARGRPGARLGGIDASDEMVAHARRHCPWAAIRHGFAEDCEPAKVVGRAPDRILFSYALSMVGAPLAALQHARASLADGGSVAVVDFGDFAGLPPTLRVAFRRYLASFRVHPLDREILRDAQSVVDGPFGYFTMARFAALS